MLVLRGSLRCHAEILHRLAGNPIGVTSIRSETTTSVMETSELLSNLPSPTLDLEEAEVQLDQQVTNALKSMNDALERIGLDFSTTQLPIPAVDVVTPSLLSISTAETNNAYETLLQSDSSLEKGPSHSEVSPTSTSRSPHNSLVRLTNRERFEMECKLRTWRSKHSKSCLSPSVLSTLPISDQRKIHSAPTSPNKQQRDGIFTQPIDSTALDSPQPFSYYSPTLYSPKSTSFNEFDSQLVSDDGTKKILEFLANKVDLLSISINTIQFNLSKIAETFQITIDEKIHRTDMKTEQIIDNKFMYLENKIDNIRVILDNDYCAVKKENDDLKEKLDDYISREADREEQLKECFNSPHHPCAVDLVSLKDELDRKLLELDVMLATSQPLSPQRSFSEECRDAPPADEHVRDDETVDRNDTEKFASIHAKFDGLTEWFNDLETQMLKLDTRVLECEQYSRRECVVISGVPDEIKEDQLEPTVINILQKLKITINSKDISAIHRLGVSRDPRYPSRVIVKFINRKIVDLCFERRDRLPDLRHTLNMNLRFYESLAHLNHESLRLCNWLKTNKKIYDHFLRNGFSKVVVAENEKPIKVPHPQFLRDKFEIPEGVH